MARLQSARVFVYQRLTAAVSEIMEHLEATFSQYEKEMESRHMTLLDSVCKAKERPLTAVQAVIKEEQQEWRLSLHQEDPEHPGGLHIKEEQQDLCSIQEVWSQLQGPQEEQIPDFPITAVLVTSEGDGEKAQLSQLHQRLCEEDREAEAPATCTAQHLGAGADGEEPCKASAAAFSGSDEIDASVIPVMVNGDMAKYVSKHGDRRPFGAFCRQAIASLDTKSRKDSIFTRLRQRPVSGELAVPAKNKPWIGNTSAKKRKRRVELGWMDFNEKERRYKQVKAVSGGGTRHLTIGKEKTVEEIKDIAEKLFFPNGFSKKKEQALKILN